MFKWALVICIAMIAISCNSILQSKPSGTLSEGEMTDVLVDIHLAEATVRMGSDSLTRLNDTTNLRIRFADVFRKHDVSPGDFNKSLDYYLKHIDVLDNIYGDVIKRLTEMEAGLKVSAGAAGINVKSTDSINSKQDSNNPWFKTLSPMKTTPDTRYFEWEKRSNEGC